MTLTRRLGYAKKGHSATVFLVMVIDRKIYIPTHTLISMENEIKDAEDMFVSAAKSSVKLMKNSRGVNWDIRAVKGEEDMLEPLMIEAIKIHKLLEAAKL